MRWYSTSPPVTEAAKRELAGHGLGFVARAPVPAEHTTFVLATSPEVQNARTGFRLLELAGNWLPVVTLLLAAAGVAVARRRRRALVTAALALAAGAGAMGISGSST